MRILWVTEVIVGVNSFAADFLAPSARFLGGKNLKTGYPPNVRKYGDYHRQRH